MMRDGEFLPVEEFWSVVEACRCRSIDTASFAEGLAFALITWDYHQLAAFHNTMWYDVGVYHATELRGILLEQEDYDWLSSQNAWESYGGWLIGQGRKFHEKVMHKPQVALTRLPSDVEIDAGERVIFAAEEACLRKTERKYGLDDMVEDFVPKNALSYLGWRRAGRGG